MPFLDQEVQSHKNFKKIEKRCEKRKLLLAVVTNNGNVRTAKIQLETIPMSTPALEYFFDTAPLKLHFNIQHLICLFNSYDQLSCKHHNVVTVDQIHFWQTFSQSLGFRLLLHVRKEAFDAAYCHVFVILPRDSTNLFIKTRKKMAS